MSLVLFLEQNGQTGSLIDFFTSSHLNPEPSYIFASGDNGYFCRSVCFAPDNHHLITVCDDNYLESKVHIWDLDKPTPIKSFKILDALSCKYSPSGSVLAVG